MICERRTAQRLLEVLVIGYLRSPLKSEEQRPRPLAAGDPPCDLGQRLVLSALELDPMIADDHLVLGAVPVAQQHGTWR